jgi:DNA-binding PadR family transcriptional regulator
MADELNATQGSLLGFLLDRPRTGWELLQAVEAGLARFWNVTSSHVYRELRTLESRGLVSAGEPGVRDRRPFTITATGRQAFGAWLSEEPKSEQIRFPLLVTLWFGRHLGDDELAGFLESSRREHERRLAMYINLRPDDPYVAAVVGFGVAYETAVIEWLRDLPRHLLQAADRL